MTSQSAQKPSHDPDRGPGTIQGTFDEIRSGTWRENARRRASRRKSKWNLLLPLFIIPLWMTLWWLHIELACLAHFLFHADAIPPFAQWMHALGGPVTLATALMFLPAFLPTMIVAMLLSNVLVYLIPPARRAMDNEDKDFPGTDYTTAQRALGKAAAVTLPITLLLAMLGAWLLP